MILNVLPGLVPAELRLEELRTENKTCGYLYFNSGLLMLIYRSYQANRITNANVKTTAMVKVIQRPSDPGLDYASHHKIIG